jgi:hypothetical protein
MHGMFRECPDSESTDRLVSADALRQEPNEEDDEEEDDRSEEDDDDYDDDDDDGYSE